MVWKKVENSRNQIKKSGKLLAKGTDDLFKEQQAIEVVDNWRAAHAYPLQIISYSLRRKFKGRNVVVVQRLKRLDSIIAKLKRQPWLSLYEMQDLAGCRVIAENKSMVYDVVEDYMSSKIKHEYHHTDDYIENPKESGYRGIHVVYRFHSETEKSCGYNGMFVEIQFRTKLQHMWSTAVETMGLYTGTNLKAGEGPPNILRFFALVSSLFAIEEQAPVVPNTSADVNELLSEIKALSKSDNILGALRAIRVATQEIARRGNNAKYYILTLNFASNRLRIKEYSKDEIELATRDYNAIERQKAENQINSVLVSAGSIDDLRYAYPNYFTDIGDFVKKIEDLLETENL